MKKLLCHINWFDQSGNKNARLTMLYLAYNGNWCAENIVKKDIRTYKLLKKSFFLKENFVFLGN